jgi:hypothetical protein
LRAGRELKARGVCDHVLQHLYADSRPVVKLKTLAAAKFFQLTDARGIAQETRDETKAVTGRRVIGTVIAE